MTTSNENRTVVRRRSWNSLVGRFFSSWRQPILRRPLASRLTFILLCLFLLVGALYFPFLYRNVWRIGFLIVAVCWFSLKWREGALR